MNYIKTIDSLTHFAPNSCHEGPPGWQVAGCNINDADTIVCVTGRTSRDQALMNICPDEQDQAPEYELFGERGCFERAAFYYSFHHCPFGYPFGKYNWGVFYYEWALRKIALKIINWSNGTIQWKEAMIYAFGLLRLHEMYHFNFDNQATQWEQIMRVPLYLPYALVYKAVFMTADCFEESLANKRMVRYAPNTVRNFAADWANKSAPGYSDYNRESVLLMRGLAGQLFGLHQLGQQQNNLLHVMIIGLQNGLMGQLRNHQNSRIINETLNNLNLMQWQPNGSIVNPEALENTPSLGFSCPEYIVKGPFENYRHKGLVRRKDED